MDPSFIPIFASQLNQHYQNLNIAKMRAQEEHDKQVLLENRQKLLEAAKQESDVLLHESSLKPQIVFVRCQIICFNLNNLKVVPDSYEDQKEKEDVTLLWRKLIGIADKCKTLMTPELFDQCKYCLDAIWMQGFIRAIAERLGAYNKVQEIKFDLEKKRVHQKKLRWISFGVLAILALTAVLFLSAKNLINTFGDLLGFLASFPGPIGLGIYLWFRYQVKAIDNTYNEYLESNNEEFWERVKEKFNGIPTEEMLKQSWKQQEAIIKVIFGEAAQSIPNA